MASSTSNFASISHVGRGVGNGIWTNATRAYDSNNLYASAPTQFGLGGDMTAYLRAVSPSAISIPAGATIDGIRFTCEGKYTASAEGEAGRDNEVYIIQGGTRSTAVNRADSNNWSASDASKTWGGAADLWGLTWADTDFGSGFGLDISLKCVPTLSESSGQFDIDHIFVDVFYTAAAGGSAVARSRLTLLGVGG